MTNTTPNNRKMAATFKKLGFEKSPLQMTRVGLTYRLIDDDNSTKFTFGKGLNDNVQVSSPRRADFPSVIIFTENKWEEIQRNEWIWPHLEAFGYESALNMRTILLAMAAGYADMIESERAN
tara:strand:- start:2055 stop:2420 length:366 start_codon:yes stop_codon:yes gene_type:complete